jgi:5-(carboxyamino)imidazole ribonucleotide synthase
MTRTIGILGGGQLGRMLTMVAKRMGYRVIVLDPKPQSPCGQLADEQITARFDNLEAIASLGAHCDVVTYEFENIPLESVRSLEDAGYEVAPSSHVLRITQDRLLEKQFINSCGIATAPFAPVSSYPEFEKAMQSIGFPAIVKTRRGGYDGKGQWRIENAAQARQAFLEAKGDALILEGFVPFEKEISVIAARDALGTIVTYPITENIHESGILSMTIAPGRVSPEVAEAAGDIARRIAEGLEIIGAFAVECFVRGNEVLVNEIAPRVHNSGHYTIEAMTISQYDMHIRAICGLPLVVPRLREPAVMINILGTGSGDDLEGKYPLMSDPDVTLHLYGKAQAADRRKMGHFTVLAPTIEEAIEKAERSRSYLRWNSTQ